MHCIVRLLGCAPDETIYFVLSGHLGSFSDKILMKTQEAQEQWKQIDEDEFVLADTGFEGFQTQHEAHLLPIKKNPGIPLSDLEKELNKKIASYRSVVKNVFTHIKK
jgi:hypothetical protein